MHLLIHFRSENGGKGLLAVLILSVSTYIIIYIHGEHYKIISLPGYVITENMVPLSGSDNIPQTKPIQFRNWFSWLSFLN